MITVSLACDQQSLKKETRRRFAGILPFFLLEAFFVKENPAGRLKLDDITVDHDENQPPSEGQDATITVRIDPCPELRAEMESRTARLKEHVRLFFLGTEKSDAKAHVEIVTEPASSESS